MAKKPEVFWAITGSLGIYLGLDWTRREAIKDHCTKLGRTWAYCRKKGDRAVLVRVRVLRKPKARRVSP